MKTGPDVVAKLAIGALSRLRFGLRETVSGSDCDDRRFWSRTVMSLSFRHRRGIILLP
jgi:hypothetical protein